ncbi:hypothetical protein PPL_06312 [Heterostelium album PN500]|uniref:Uncharacterized protein n=1 Tax=Heterostelium pallidum (strain ATCC 26659 / Pp 5 / PN500) TaxID=670386 RepID=D3BCT4_HETP5|nr:hypothetical protein PPL_06312 [Heterostelium album PN500]EFA80726.1 hypothetical protein PPL_06312 [Heterostelium album PN500]|eukprot:XP_020432846.1 hypothetical protein PPL_06312 [Heterostelium album PN500]
MLINNLKNITFSSGNLFNNSMISLNSTISKKNSNIEDSLNQISATKVVKPFWAVCTTKAMDNASTLASIDILKYLHYRTEGCSAYAVENDIKECYIELIEWILANRTDFDTEFRNGVMTIVSHKKSGYLQNMNFQLLTSDGEVQLECGGKLHS